jgi:hypothetical protein
VQLNIIRHLLRRRDHQSTSVRILTQQGTLAEENVVDLMLMVVCS